MFVEKGIALEFDSGKIPFLGVWMNNGGFKNMHSAALEPCTLPFDSPVDAEKRGNTLMLYKGDRYSFKVCFRLFDERNG